MTKLKALILSVFALALTAQADAATILLDKAGWINGSEALTWEFQAPGAGELTVTLTNFAWPERLASLSFVISSSTSLLGDPLLSEGIGTFTVDGPGAYFAHIAGVAQGTMQLGLYGLQISFEPLGAEVPLPAAGWMLLAGLAGLAGMLRGKTRLTPDWQTPDWQTPDWQTSDWQTLAVRA